MTPTPRSRRLRRWVRRHRRPLAAALAGLASLTAILALRGAPAAPLALDSGVAVGASPTQGGTLVPVTLAIPGSAAVLRGGDVVDLVTVDETGTARVVATDARVTTRSAGTTLIGGSAATVLLVAVPPEQAVDLAAVAATATLTAIIREAASDG